jgi:chromate transporter
MNKSCYGIFKTFFKVGTMLLGGGYVILPLLTHELVDKKHWITSEQLYEYYALSSSLPGVIAVNTAVFTGNKLLGVKGALAAIIGMILPAFLAIVLLASILSQLAEMTWVQNIFWGVGIAVITLLFLAIKEMWKNSVNDKFSTAIYIGSLILALSKKVSLALIIIGAIIFGIFYQKMEDRKIGGEK